MWNVNLLTIFPEIFESFLKTSLVSKAIGRGLFKATITNIRDFSLPPHNKVDDTPYGGGAGMVMLPEPLVNAIESVKQRDPHTWVVLLSPSGARFDQLKAHELSQRPSVTFVCGRYEGIDQRVVDLTIDEEISVGDYVVMGGEVPAMLIIEASLRLRPGVLHNAQSVSHESFSPDLADGELLEAPQYTRPESFRGINVPDVLLSGNHKAIAEWRLKEAQAKTKRSLASKKK
ncbi:MAG: tRNA ((37)-N1)-methyltransferase TrmD [Pseudomonadota bacterium]